MKFFIRTISMSLVTVLTVTSLTFSAFAAEKPFTDVKSGAWYESAVETVYSEGIMEGKAEGKFAPNAQMTRAELVTVLCRLSGEEKTADLFNISDAVWENLSDAEMELCEVRIRASKKDDIPKLSAESLREDYAEQMPSLLATIHVAGRRLKALLRKKEK